MPDFSSGTLFYRAIDVVPVLTPELEAELALRMDEARSGMLSALLSSPEGRAAFLEPLKALANGEQCPVEVVDRTIWGIRNGILPDDRKSGLLDLACRLAEGDLTAGTVLAVHPNWVFIEKAGTAVFDSRYAGEPCGDAPEDPAAAGFHQARKLQSGVLERLVEANIRLVVKWARRYGRLTPVDEMDLVQEGCEGLIAAARRFDFHRGFRFSTYAVWWIRQAILKALMRNARLIRIPAHASILQGEMGRVRQQYLEKLGRYPSEEELVEEIGVTLEMLRAVHQSSLETLSLDRSLGEDGDSTIHDLISMTPPGRGAVSDAVRRDLKERIRKALKALDDREKRIILRKYGLDGSEPVTLAQIGREMDLSRERVRQLESRALQKLKEIGILFPEDCNEDS